MVDVFGVNASTDKPKWEAYSVSEYWQAGNTTRRDVNRYTFEFWRKNESNQTLFITDPHWSQWLDTGASYLVVLADIPGLPGSSDDPRRLILPLADNTWDKSSDESIQILVKESGLKLLTPRKEAVTK